MRRDRAKGLERKGVSKEVTDWWERMGQETSLMRKQEGLEAVVS